MVGMLDAWLLVKSQDEIELMESKIMQLDCVVTVIISWSATTCSSAYILSFHFLEPNLARESAASFPGIPT